MRHERRFWHESDSCAMPDEASVSLGDAARAQQRIVGTELGRWYDTIAKEPVPEEWLALLDQCESDRKDVQVEQKQRAGPT